MFFMLHYDPRMFVYKAMFDLTLKFIESLFFQHFRTWGDILDIFAKNYMILNCVWNNTIYEKLFDSNLFLQEMLISKGEKCEDFTIRNTGYITKEFIEEAFLIAISIFWETNF